MKTSRLVLRVVMLIFIAGFAKADGVETPICTDPNDQSDPSISGNRIVWRDYRNGNYDIYLYDLDTGIETPICTNPSLQWFPSISGNKIVWYDLRNGNPDIYLYDLNTEIETPICTNPYSQTHPSISGNKIVWDDYRNGNYDIYLYDLDTMVETRITTDASDQDYPSISGNRIVWEDDRNGNWDTYLYDLNTGIETPICTNTSDQFVPSISGNKIVWYDLRNGNPDIYLYDLNTGIETPICTNPSDQVEPSIAANRIVWTDYRNGNWDTYLYDLITGIETPICTNTSSQIEPSIAGNKLVWCDWRNGNYDIFSFALEPDISYCQDFLEVGNPGGRTGGLKTCDFDNPEMVYPGDTFSIDIWVTDVPPPDLTAGIISSGFLMTYNPAQLSLVSVEAYDNVDIAGGPWDGSSTLKGPDVIGPGSYLLALAQLSCAIPDAGGDVILAKVTFQSLAEGNAAITLSRIPDFDTTVGCTYPPVTVYDTQMGTTTITITSTSATSCDEYCGLQAPGGCFCDEYCHTAGDCCADKCIYCPSQLCPGYCQDILEPGNPGGQTTGLKTCDTVNPVTINPGDTFAMDIWASNFPETIISSGFEMFYNPAQMSIVSVKAYDGVDLPGPWDGSITMKIPDAYGPGSYALALLQLNCAIPDGGGDVILANVIFQCEVSGTADISVRAITDIATTVGCSSGIVYDAQMGTNTVAVSQGLVCGNGIVEQISGVYWEDCDDGNTADGDCCSSTCLFESGSCADDNACTTGDTCSNGVCVGGLPLICDDGNDCTDDSCNPASGCLYINNNASCNDGQFCNGADTCSGGSCSVHGVSPCPGADGDSDCSESCNETTDSCTANDPNGSACNDATYCNGADTCSSGSCSTHSGDPCLPLICDEETDSCTETDSDGDGVPDNLDNCPNNPNLDQLDTLPPQGNSCGDACECEGNFDGDADQDGTDAFIFKQDFGRGRFNNPCTNEAHCNGDLTCDGDVDGTDAFNFKRDFGRGTFNRPCPNCETIPWCVYP